MQSDSGIESLEALRDIRGMMQRSGRFLSLSGYSGIWAGCSALAGAAAARFSILPDLEDTYLRYDLQRSLDVQGYSWLARPLLLGAIIFIVALAGGYFFTRRKARRQGTPLWNHASRALAWHVALPMVVGAVLCVAFLRYGHAFYIAPACLLFYGLALINGSKFTVGEVRYLGYLEIVLGCINLFLPHYGLLLWSIGFGVLHILYGIIMWRKYDSGSSNNA